MIVPKLTVNTVAVTAMSSETLLPKSRRARMSRPVNGSTPSGCAQLTPPAMPLGKPPLSLINSGWKSYGFTPIALVIQGAAIAKNEITRMTASEIIATTSCRRRRHASAAGLRPTISVCSAITA